MAEHNPAQTEQSLPQPRFTLTLGGSQWSTATYGIVEFLRRHPMCRATVAILGVLSGITAIASFAGFKLPGLTSSVVLFVLTPWLLWIATLAGPEFRLAFPTEQASKERQKAEKEFEESHTAEDALKLDLSRLNEYYVINQTQARSSFRWAIFSMFVGFGTIISGIWFFYLRGNQPDTFMASLSTAAGCIVNLVSGLFLYLHSKTQDRSLHYYEQLSRLQKLSMAIRLIESHEDAKEKANARNLVIRELVRSDPDSIPASSS